MTAIDAPIRAFIQDRLGFSDREMDTFKANPTNTELIRRGLELQDKEIVFEVIDAHGCYTHHVGQQIIFDPLGNLIMDKCPQRICHHAIAATIASFDPDCDHGDTVLDVGMQLVKTIVAD